MACVRYIYMLDNLLLTGSSHNERKYFKEIALDNFELAEGKKVPNFGFRWNYMIKYFPIYLII